jgi:prevent-host-death family protein
MVAGRGVGVDQVGQGVDSGGEDGAMTLNLYEAKTQLSQLVERAAAGEEVVIAKAGKPMVRLVPVEAEKPKKRISGTNALGVTYIADDFDAPLPDDILEAFGY